MKSIAMPCAIVVALWLVSGCVRVPAPPLTTMRPDATLVAEEGEARMTIVVGVNAAPSTRHAAEELQHFLTKMTGATMPLVTDDAPPAPSEIWIGDNQRLRDANVLIDYEVLGQEGYVIRTRGRHIFITGGEPRGTLYGVYGFLEDHLGCRWFTPDVSSIPEAPTLAVLPIDEVRTPALEYREPFVYECFDGDWAARNRVNSSAARLQEHHGGKVTYHGFVHTFESLVPPDTYFDAHPEYFSLVDGKRLKVRSQLCCTNESVIKIVTDEVRRGMSAHPEATVFSVSQNDWYNYCECDQCTALAEAEGSQMAPVLQLVNHVARAVADDFPDKLVDTLAYQYTRKPPATIRPEPNVVIRLCSIECDFAHPFEERTTAENRAFCDDLESWAEIADRLWVWNYNTSFAHYLVPFPNLRVRAPNIRYMIENNVRGIFEQDVYNTPHGQWSTLSGYLGAKLLWNPNYDADLAINEFLQGVYGEAATPMRLYIDLMHEAVSDPTTNMNIWIGPDAPFFTDELFERADNLFDVAEAAVAECPEIRERVQIARMPVDYSIIERTRAMTGEAFILDHEQFTIKIHPDFERRVNRFLDTAERHGLQLIREHDGTLEKYKQEVLGYVNPQARIPMEMPEQPRDMAPGIAYFYYAEHLERLPDFSELMPVAAGVANTISLAPAQDFEHEAFALLFQGYIHIPQDGMYAFTTVSNDGSKLYIGDRLVVDNDGLHRERAETGFIALQQGWHPIRAPYFEAGGAHALAVYYTGPDIPYQEIPPEALRHNIM